MTIRNLLIEGLSLLAALFLGGPVAAQTAPSGPTATVNSIDVTDARPIPRALDIIEQRYGVTIDYVDAEYSNPQDLQTVTVIRGVPAKKPFPIPKVRALNLYYQEMSGTPIGGITALIQSVLTQFANDGGPVFAVRELTMPYGPRWEVYPKEARDPSGALVAQPDVLDAVIQIPTEKRTSSEMVGEIGRQLSATRGRKFNIAQFRDAPIRGDNVERGAENVTALTALLRLTGQQEALRAFYMPDNNQYYVSIGPRPYHQPTRPLPPAPRAAPTRTRPAPVAVWLRRSLYYKGKMDIQTALSQAGFLRTAATGEWDASTIDAISRFQSANHLEVTGRINAATIRKLEPFLPQLEAHPAPQVWANGMYPALASWLQSNPQGWTDIQTALAKEGFYSGNTSGMLDLKTRNALKAFQARNGLRQTGVFDRPTAEQLAPFIPKPGEEPPVATR